MKQTYHKVSHALMTLLLLVSTFLPLLSSSPRVSAAELGESDYQLTTDVTINTNPLKDTGYGEGKFYIAPTYTFADSKVLNNGDTLVYHVPSQFKIERTLEENISAPDGTVVAKLVTDPVSNTANITVTNAEYYAKMPDAKRIQSSFTVVWADDMPYDQEREVNFPGARTYRLKRIKVDEEPQGYSKWGVQDSKDPNYVNWRIRVNRDVQNFGQVVIEDAIPEDQELDEDTGITGYYFTEWEGVSGTRQSFNPSDVVTITDSNHFSVNAGELNGRGIYVIYRTRLTKPVDKVTKKAFNDVTVTSNGQKMPELVSRPFAPLTTLDGVGEGSRSDEVIFKVKKELTGRNLADGEFTFDLINKDDNDKVIQTVTNKDGAVTFNKLRFKSEGTFNYVIRERASNLPGVTNDVNSDINVTVTVTDNKGVKTATVAYDRDAFTNTYKLEPATAAITAKKVLDGKALEAGKYTFKLTEVGGNNVEHQTTNDANGNINFPEINYDKEGTYTYKLKEVAGSEAGVTYDSTEHTVTVTVTENNAKLEAAVTDNNPTFTNSYKDYGVSYEFLSSNPAYPNLPKEVTDLLPADTNRYTSGTNVDAKQPAKISVTVTEGTWTFEGYAETNAQTVADKDLKFTGKWNFTPAPKYKVTYEFVSADPNRTLPAEVTEWLPTDANEYTDGTAVQAVQPAKKTVEATDGTWKFLKYDADSKTIAGSDVKFTGTWTFEANRPKDPDKTPSPSSSKDVPIPSTSKKVLPKTGSETSNFAMAAGFALILLSALVYRFKKAN
ncbi:collagen-binding surface protein [Streptococcus sanguinis SK49]|uniref:Collagen-binding surface protein n=1 Tax=Streptococcus sanguinis SK49 TaxID=888808 RepID=F3UY46_STRSA|nr:SHIRT domain-containing protein [Streptococcus sanguinis]EGJ38163.1 collagen-binding surface protein [Streptococcus sanguinis SK49]RSJ39586.1 T surface-antigen of pili [Streptococcus sanguinis]